MSSASLLSRASKAALQPSASRYLARSPNCTRLLNSFGPPTQSQIAPHSVVRHMPFDYLDKRAFTYKFITFVGLGFALPWVAVGWIWYRPGGFKNP
ncbi:hypothetical protein GYMLUDRAFT_37867 [Collybiopsis luxurians FD-317 M1]|nr:hypothetical protein GYMLUDRAFT_37867 [Collybiopsis luxurians FD-317 M1]